MRRIAKPVGGLTLVLLLVAGCSNAANSNDKQNATKDLRQYQISQPAPFFKWSQIRQTLIDIETAQTRGSQTTSFFFNLGVAAPIQSCPSIGFPVATTTQVTNPTQEQDQAAINAIDPNGVYSGNSTGTYVLCVAPDGKPYAQYWEGFVDAVSGPAVWDNASHSIKLTGPSTVTLHTR